MKPRLNILGRKHKIVQIDFKAGTDDVIDHVMYEAFENDGVTKIYKTLCDSSSSLKDSYDYVDDLASLIVDDSPSQIDKLIEHLEDMYKEEVQTLEDLKTEMAETRTELPCEKIGDLLAQKQNEYFLMQQRVFGIIDTIEEAKACTEGFYANVEDPAVEA